MEVDLDRLREMFARMMSDGFDTTCRHKWGFFFIDHDRNRLEEFARGLETSGYDFVSIHEADSGDWVLWVSRTEIHSVESLHERNVAFNRLTAQHRIKLYDGWDVDVVCADDPVIH